MPHLRQDWARPHAHIWTGTGLTAATSAPGLASPLPTSAPGLQVRGCQTMVWNPKSKELEPTWMPLYASDTRNRPPAAALGVAYETSLSIQRE